MNKSNEKNGRGKRILTVKKKVDEKNRIWGFQRGQSMLNRTIQRKKRNPQKNDKNRCNCMVSGKE